MAASSANVNIFAPIPSWSARFEPLLPRSQLGSISKAPFSSLSAPNTTTISFGSIMAVTALFAGEMATELLKTLIAISLKSCLHKSSAKQLISSIEQLQPIILEIKYSGVELPASRQSQLDRLSENLRDGLKLSHKVLASPRWNVFKNLRLARKMEKLDKTVSRFLSGLVPVHVLADVHHLRFETAA